MYFLKKYPNFDITSVTIVDWLLSDEEDVTKFVESKHKYLDYSYILGLAGNELNVFKQEILGLFFPDGNVVLKSTNKFENIGFYSYLNGISNAFSKGRENQNLTNGNVLNWIKSNIDDLSFFAKKTSPKREKVLNGFNYSEITFLKGDELKKFKEEVLSGFGINSLDENGDKNSFNRNIHNSYQGTTFSSFLRSTGRAFAKKLGYQVITQRVVYDWLLSDSDDITEFLDSDKNHFKYNDIVQLKGEELKKFKNEVLCGFSGLEDSSLCDRTILNTKSENMYKNLKFRDFLHSLASNFRKITFNPNISNKLALDWLLSDEEDILNFVIESEVSYNYSEIVKMEGAALSEWKTKILNGFSENGNIFLNTRTEKMLKGVRFNSFLPVLARHFRKYKNNENIKSLTVLNWLRSDEDDILKLL